MLSDISIRRPVLAAVASLLVIVFGLGAVFELPIRELPDIDTAVITVRTTYTGADPEIVDTDITEILEASIAGISGIKSLASGSRRGQSNITIEFNVDRDIDEAANDVRDAVARVRSELPEDVDEPQIVKSDTDSDPVMRLAVTSTLMTPAEITDYVDRYIKDRLATVDGVASVDMYGDRPFAVRIWLDRRAMAARNLTVADVTQAVKEANIELPAGEIESDARELTVRLASRIPSVEAFRNIVIADIAGYPIRLSDVARVIPGSSDDTTIVRQDGRQAVGIQIIRQSQSNTIAISNSIRAEVAKMAPTLPAGMSIEIGSDDAIFVAASITEVVKALVEALALVVVVILLFLRSWRATLIPAITIPISLIGTFALIAAMGFSINVLTLLALLLAIGLVVDDAIVVLENIQRRIDGGESPLVAAFLGTRQVTFAVIATSLTLIAVFVPISFLGGDIGRLFTEFGFVMASAVLISTFVALSACPALASKILSRHKWAKPGATREGILLRVFRRLVGGAVRTPALVLVVALVIAGTGAYTYTLVPKELSPTEDRGTIFIPLTGPEGATVNLTDIAARQVEAAADPFVRDGSVAGIFNFIGAMGRGNRAFIVLRLADWSERDRTAAQISSALGARMRDVTAAMGRPGTPSGLGLRGSRTPLQVVVSGPDFESVKGWAQKLLEAAEANSKLENVELDYEENTPQLDISINRDRADDLGVTSQTIAETLQTLLASREVSTFATRGREYPVLMQAEGSDRASPADIDFIFVRARDGATLVPLSSLVAIKDTAAAAELRRYNRLPSITVQGALAEGYTLGEAIGYMQNAARDVLPPEASLSLRGQSQQFEETSSGVATTFALALLIVFLVLAAQFESFVHPFVIMLTVPLGVAGAVFSLYAAGLTVNIYSQIGIILLIGLMAKNGILIVEFANQLRDDGLSVREAIIDATVLRLRPIVMTVVATILGAVPLVLASGAGAESRIAIGTVIIGGLSLASVLTLFVTPVLYDLLARFTNPRSHVERAIASELAGAGVRTAAPVHVPPPTPAE